MKLKSFLKIAIFGLLVSCSDENIIFNDYVDIENTQLSFKDTIVFQTKITDTINPHNIFLQLRTSTDYKWSNMFVFSEIYFPNNKTRTDTFEVFLMDKKEIGMAINPELLQISTIHFIKISSFL